MNNQLEKVRRFVEFRGTDTQPLEITDEQYQALKSVINDVRFVEINDQLYATSEIKDVLKLNKSN